MLLAEWIRCLFNANFYCRFLWAIFITLCNNIILPVLITGSNPLYKTAKIAYFCTPAEYMVTSVIGMFMSIWLLVRVVIIQVALYCLCTCTDFAYCYRPAATKRESRRGFAVQNSVHLWANQSMKSQCRRSVVNACVRVHKRANKSIKGKKMTKSSHAASPALTAFRRLCRASEWKGGIKWRWGNTGLRCSAGLEFWPPKNMRGANFYKYQLGAPHALKAHGVTRGDRWQTVSHHIICQLC